MTFEPSRFWRTSDWSSSSTRQKPGYIEDCVLFAGGFDEVNIHLFPSVRRVRVWVRPDTAAYFKRNGILPANLCRAVIFVEQGARDQVEAFSPTVYTFETQGFEPVPSHEHVSRAARTAISCRTLRFNDAIAEWHIEVCYVKSLTRLISDLKNAEIIFNEQTA